VFNHRQALIELRRLGRRLDLQVTEQTGSTPAALDATLRLMKQVHTEIELSIGASMLAVARRRAPARAGAPKMPRSGSNAPAGGTGRAPAGRPHL
jgi:hypothetical protein